MDVRLKGLELKNSTLPSINPRESSVRSSPRRTTQTLAKSFPIKAPHLFSVGRLDAIAEGLLLVTNDGEFANRVSHPRYGIPKEYLVKVQGKLGPGALQAVLQGVWDAGELLKPSSVSIVSEVRKTNGFVS